MTLTSWEALYTEPSFILARAITFCVSASRMRVLASATPLAGREVERDDARPRVGVGQDHHLAHVGLLGHRALDSDRHGHRVAVLGDLREVELDLALLGLLPSRKLFMSSSASFFAALAGVAKPPAVPSASAPRPMPSAPLRLSSRTIIASPSK